MALTTVRPEGMGFNTGRRNLIINGAMQVAQRGTSHTQSPNSGNYHTVDRYSYRRSGTWSGVTAVELSQESSGGPVGFKNFLRYAPTGSDATTPDNACMLVDYKLEGQDIRHLEWGTSNAKTITISFYVRSSVTGTWCLNIRNTTPTRQYVKEYTIDSADTWERKSLTFPGDTSGTWANDDGTGLCLMWFVTADTDSPSESGRLVTGNQWNTTSTTNTYTSNQSDGITTSANQTFDLAGIQLEVGENASDFEHRSFGEELALCQRYYYQTLTGAAYQRHGLGVAVSSGFVDMPYRLPQTMRTRPSTTKSGSMSVESNTTKSVSAVTISTDSSSADVVRYGITCSTTLTVGYGYYLFNGNDADAHLTFDAEL